MIAEPLLAHMVAGELISQARHIMYNYVTLELYVMLHHVYP